MSAKVHLQKNDIRRFASDSALNFIEVLFDNAEAVRHTDSAEALHDMRVASRRLRECFRLFDCFYAPGKLRKTAAAVKKVTRILGITREMDVNVGLLRAYKPRRAEWLKACHEYLLEIYEFERARRRKGMLKGFDKLDLKSLESKLIPFVQTAWNGASAPSLPLDSLQADTLKQFLDNAARVLQEKAIPIRAFAAVDSSAKTNDEDLHRLRIDVKRCRYCLEILNPLYTRRFDKGVELARGLQDILGKIHDYGVLIEQLKAQHTRLKEKRRTCLAKGSRQVIDDLELRKQSFYAEVGPAYSACLHELQHCLPPALGVSATPPVEAEMKKRVVDPAVAAEHPEPSEQER